MICSLTKLFTLLGGIVLLTHIAIAQKAYKPTLIETIKLDFESYKEEPLIYSDKDNSFYCLWLDSSKSSFILQGYRITQNEKVLRFFENIYPIALKERDFASIRSYAVTDSILLIKLNNKFMIYRLNDTLNTLPSVSYSNFKCDKLFAYESNFYAYSHFNYRNSTSLDIYKLSLSSEILQEHIYSQYSPYIFYTHLVGNYIDHYQNLVAFSTPLSDTLVVLDLNDRKTKIYIDSNLSEFNYEQIDSLKSQNYRENTNQKNFIYKIISFDSTVKRIERILLFEDTLNLILKDYTIGHDYRKIIGINTNTGKEIFYKKLPVDMIKTEGKAFEWYPCLNCSNQLQNIGQYTIVLDEVYLPAQFLKNEKQFYYEKIKENGIEYCEKNGVFWGITIFK